MAYQGCIVIHLITVPCPLLTYLDVPNNGKGQRYDSYIDMGG